MDIDVVAVNGAIRAFGAINAPCGVIRTPGVISTPEDRAVTKEAALGVMRGGDAGVVTKEEGRNSEKLFDLVDLTDKAGNIDEYLAGYLQSQVVPANRQSAPRARFQHT